MKRFLLSLTSLLLVVSLFGQSNARTGFLKDDYLKKQKPEEGSKDTSGRWRCSSSNGVRNTTRENLRAMTFVSTLYVKTIKMMILKLRSD